MSKKDEKEIELEEDEIKQIKRELRKKSIFFKAKKNMSEKFMTSKTGKKLMNKVLDDDIKRLIVTVKDMISIESGKKEVSIQKFF